MQSQLISEDTAPDQSHMRPTRATPAAPAAPRLTKDQAQHIAGRLKKGVAVGAFVGFGALSALVGTHLATASTNQTTTSSGDSSSSSSSSQSSSDGGFFSQQTGGSSNGSFGSSASSSSPVSGSSVS